MTGDSPPRLIITAAQRDVLRQQAEAAFPKEFCALLIGRDDGAGVCHVTRVIPAVNVHPEPLTGFEVDPRILIGTLRDLREAEKSGQGSGERLLGHVHSHPDGPAHPSARDLALAFDSGQFWLVAAVRNGRFEAIAGFQTVADGSGGIVFRPITVDGVVEG